MPDDEPRDIERGERACGRDGGQTAGAGAVHGPRKGSGAGGGAARADGVVAGGGGGVEGGGAVGGGGGGARGGGGGAGGRALVCTRGARL